MGYGLYAYNTDQWMIFALLAVLALSFIAQARVQGTYKKYAAVPAKSGLPAHVVAENLLAQTGSGVRVTPVAGSLTDHYNPKQQTVGLSQDVYGESSVAALAVAAHEIGHVMQYEEGYMPIRIRNAILPVANFGSRIAPFIVILGLIMGSFDLAIAGAILFGAVFLFQVVTLPVEFNASSRAIEMLERGGYVEYEESQSAKKVLRAAAFTYVVGALSTLITLLRLLGLANRSRRN